MSEAECWERCYGGPRHIKVLHEGTPAEVATPQIWKFLERRLHRRERKAA